MKSFALYAVLFVAVQSGCTLPAESREGVGQVSESLGESGCGTLGGVPYTGASNNGIVATLPAWLSTTSNTTPSGYGSDSSCPGQFIAEYAGMGSSDVYKAYLTPAGFFGSAIECPKLTATIGLYYWNSSTSSFYFHHGKTLTGVYPGSGSTCNFKDASDGSAWTWENVNGADTNKLRVTTSLYYNGTTHKFNATKLYRAN